MAKFQRNREVSPVRSQAFENPILNGFRNKEGSGICWTGDSESLAEGTK